MTLCGGGGVFGRTPDGHWTDTVWVWGCVRTDTGRTLCGCGGVSGRTPDGHQTDTVWVWGCARTDTGPTLCGCGGVFYVRLASVCCVICLPSVCPVSFISPSCVRLHFRNFWLRTYGNEKKATLIYPLASLKRSLGI